MVMAAATGPVNTSTVSWSNAGLTTCQQRASVSALVRAIASERVKVSHGMVKSACDTLLAVEKMVNVATLYGTELASLLEQCDVVTIDVLDAFDLSSGGYDRLLKELLEHLGRVKALAERCARSGKPHRRLLFGGKISRDLGAARLKVVSFANANNLAHSRKHHDERVARLARRVKIPDGALRLHTWYAERKAVIATTCDLLGISSNDRDASPEAGMVGLAGPSGSGKSLAASMVAVREDVRARFHKGVLWLSVGPGGRERLPVLMYRLADMMYENVLGLQGRAPRTPDIGVDPEDGATYIREIVGGSTRRVLVVADDVWEPEVLEAIRGTGVSVLYTTRAHKLLADDPLRLDRVEKLEAEVVLRRAAGLKNRAVLPDEAYEVMERCGWNVVNLAFVGRWGSVRGRTDGEAWRTIIERTSKVQNESLGPAALSWQEATLRAGLRELAQHSQLAQLFYLFLGVMPKGLAFSLSDASAVLLDGVSEELTAIARVATKLERLAILSRQVGGLFRAHSVHASFARDILAEFPESRARVLSRWRDHISTADALFSWPLDALVDIWRDIAELGGRTPSSPYDRALATMSASDPRLAQALRRVAFFHWLAGDRDVSCAKWKQLVDGWGEAQEPSEEFPQLGLTFHSLGMQDERSGRLASAETWFKRALSVEETQLGGDHPRVADTLHHLAWCASNLERVDKAESLHWRALMIRERNLRVDHPDIARTLRGLGICAFKTGRTEDARGFLHRALAILERNDASCHARVARALYDLGRCAYADSRAQEAENLFRRALAIQEDPARRSLIPAADTLCALAGTLSDEGRAEEAVQAYRRALDIKESALPPHHPDIAHAAHALGSCLCDLTRTVEADTLCRRALAILESARGVDHPAVADVVCTLGVCEIEAGKIDNAVELFCRALSIVKDELDGRSSKMAHTLFDLGRCALKAGWLEESERLFLRTLAIQEAKLGGDHPEVARALCALGDCAFRDGRITDAEERLRRALKIRETRLGSNNLRVAEVLHALGNCLLATKRLAESELLFRRALCIFEERKMPADHPDVANVRSALRVCTGDLAASATNFRPNGRGGAALPLSE